MNCRERPGNLYQWGYRSCQECIDKTKAEILVEKLNREPAFREAIQSYCERQISGD